MGEALHSVEVSPTADSAASAAPVAPVVVVLQPLAGSLTQAPLQFLRSPLPQTLHSLTSRLYHLGDLLT